MITHASQITFDNVIQVDTQQEYDDDNECHRQTIWFGHGGKYNCYHDITATGKLNYESSFGKLMPVAIKAYDELQTLMPDLDGQDHIDAFKVWDVICQLSTWHDIGKLFDATYSAIQFLNSLKQPK